MHLIQSALFCTFSTWKMSPSKFCKLSVHCQLKWWQLTRCFGIAPTHFMRAPVFLLTMRWAIREHLKSIFITNHSDWNGVWVGEGQKKKSITQTDENSKKQTMEIRKRKTGGRCEWGGRIEEMEGSDETRAVMNCTHSPASFSLSFPQRCGPFIRRPCRQAKQKQAAVL